jgi:hypothetical protein
MSETVINASPERDYYSEAQQVYIENRGGAGFGKIYIYRDGRRGQHDEVEAIMLWVADGGISDCGSIVTTDEQRSRAVKAMCETEWGASALGMPYEEPAPPPDETSKLFARIKQEIEA